MKKTPIALQLYSVRNELHDDFEGTLKKVKALGFQGVEFAGLYGRSTNEIRAMVDALGLTPISAHVPIDEMLAAPDATMEAYQRIGCSYIVVPWLEDKRRPGAAEYEITIKGIEMLVGCAKKHGLTLLYHNHDFEFVKIGGKYALDMMYENIPALMTELDTCWIGVAGEDPAHYVEKYTGRAPIVHLKDYFLPGKKPQKMYELIGGENKGDADDGVFEFRPVGYGRQDFASIMAAVEKAGSKWCVIEQDMPSMGKTPLECAEMSIRYLKGL
jgi:sugar phosphate isomerase/epimerase